MPWVVLYINLGKTSFSSPGTSKDHLGGDDDGGTSVFIGELVVGLPIGEIVGLFAAAADAAALGALGTLGTEAGSNMMTSGAGAAVFGLVRAAVAAAIGDRVGVLPARLRGDVFIGLRVLPVVFGDPAAEDHFAAGVKTTPRLGDLLRTGLSTCMRFGDCALLGIAIRPEPGLLAGERDLLPPEPRCLGLEVSLGLFGLDCGVFSFLASRMTR